MSWGSGERLATAAVGCAIALAICASSWAPAASAQTYVAPDPGGSEFQHVAVPPPGKLFGMNEDVVDMSHGQSPEAYAEYISVSGGNAVRTILEWWRAEQWEADQWIPRRWQVWQETYDAMRSRGITPIWVLANAPIWARENPELHAEVGCHACRFPPRPEMDGEWAEFVAEIALRFPHSIIQVWNEPNMHYWWGQAPPDPERYAELVAIAYDAVQEVESKTGVETPVVAPALAGIADTAEAEADPNRMSTRDFLDRAYAAPQPLAEHIDALAANIFPHSSDFGENSLLAAVFHEMRQARRAAGDDSPILVSESGLPAGFDFPFDEVTRAISLFFLYNKLMSMPDVNGVIFHRVIEPFDNQPGNKFQLGYAWMKYSEPPGFREQAPDPEPKLVYCMFAELAKGVYEPCLETTIVSGPTGRWKKRTARFEFHQAPAGTTTTRFECSLDSRPYKRCASGKRYRKLKPGKHRFAVRSRNSNGHRGKPDRRAFKVVRRR